MSAIDSRYSWSRCGIVSTFEYNIMDRQQRTSRFKIKSCTTLIICAIVTSFPPSPREGCANSMGLPSRSRPRASRRLLMYVDAVLRLYDSIVVVARGCCGQWWCWASQPMFVYPRFRRKLRPPSGHYARATSTSSLQTTHATLTVSSALVAYLRIRGRCPSSALRFRDWHRDSLTTIVNCSPARSTRLDTSVYFFICRVFCDASFCNNPPV